MLNKPLSESESESESVEHFCGNVDKHGPFHILTYHIFYERIFYSSGTEPPLFILLLYYVYVHIHIQYHAWWGDLYANRTD